MKKHIPVLRSEVTQVLIENLKKEDLIIDATLGRGGHFLELLSHFNNLIGLDADKDSTDYVASMLVDYGFKENGDSYIKEKKQVKLINANFSKLNNLLNGLKPKAVLFDLGISMYHYKESNRGFSFLNLQEPLDMRIDIVNNSVKACDLVNLLSERDLTNLLRNLGEEYAAKKYAALIAKYRERKKIETVGDLLTALKIDSNVKYKVHPATKIFMALRIAVNSEHINLKEVLNEFYSELKLGLLFLIITFHSLEEKTVENFCRENSLNFKKIYPANEEITKNKSSRSSKLFVIKNV